MKIAYRRKDDAKAIDRGRKATHTLRGVITERFMDGMGGDEPEIRVRSEANEESNWGRQVNKQEQEALYRVGRRIEIDYVVRRMLSGWKLLRWKQAIEIRVEDTQDEVPGSYERLRAKEIAQYLLSHPAPNVLEYAYQLAELGHTPGVMHKEVHQIFMDARCDIDRLLSAPRPQSVGDADLNMGEHEIGELETRWKEKIFAACRKMLDEQS
jgi:hypothetical protein